MSKSKHLNLKRIQLFLTWIKIPIKLISINLKWSIAMIDYNKLACNLLSNSITLPNLMFND